MPLATYATVVKRMKSSALYPPLPSPGLYSANSRFALTTSVGGEILSSAGHTYAVLRQTCSPSWRQTAARRKKKPRGRLTGVGRCSGLHNIGLSMNRPLARTVGSPCFLMIVLRLEKVLWLHLTLMGAFWPSALLSMTAPP